MKNSEKVGIGSIFFHVKCCLTALWQQVFSPLFEQNYWCRLPGSGSPRPPWSLSKKLRADNFEHLFRPLKMFEKLQEKTCYTNFSWKFHFCGQNWRKTCLKITLFQFSRIYLLSFNKTRDIPEGQRLEVMTILFEIPRIQGFHPCVFCCLCPWWGNILNPNTVRGCIRH